MYFRDYYCKFVLAGKSYVWSLIDQEEKWLEKQELKKKGKEALGDRKQQEEDYGEQ